MNELANIYFVGVRSIVNNRPVYEWFKLADITRIKDDGKQLTLFFSDGTNRVFHSGQDILDELKLIKDTILFNLQDK